MSTRITCIIVLIVLVLIEIGPIPVTGMIGLYVVIFRPFWFKELVDRIYAGKVLPRQ